jgi:hypothetical protein
MSKERIVKGMRQWVLVGVVFGLALLMMPSGAEGASLVVDFGISYDFPPRMSLTFDSEYIGSFMQGTLNQDGGTNTVTNSLYLGRYLYGNGAYNLSGSGILSAGSVYIGYYGTGTFNQTGGANTVTNELILASNQGSSGTYNLWDGSLTAGTIKANPGGTFNQEGGSLNATTFWQAGGMVLGTLENKGNFIYDSGIFDGRLLNFGSLTLHANFAAENGMLNESATPLQLAPAQILTLNGLGLDNQSTLRLAGSTLSGSGPLINNGFLEGFGTISGSGGFTNNGNLSPSGGKLTLSNTGANLNNGTVEVAENSSLELSQDITLTNNNTGTLQLNLGDIEGEGKLMNLGTLTGKGNIASNFENTGNLVVQDGTINIDKAFTNGGLILMESYTASLSGGDITNQGTIAGHGLVENSVFNNGLIEPSGSNLTIKGPLTNNSSGIVKVTTGNLLTLEEMLGPNQGKILIENGDLEINSGDLINAMVVNVNGGSLKVNGGLINKNSLELSSTLMVQEYVLNTGIMTVGSSNPDAVTILDTPVVTNEAIMDIVNKTQISGKVENTSTGAISIKAETQFAQELENTGSLTIEAGVSAAKIANKESASLVVGQTDPAAAITVVAAPVANEGLLDIVGKVEFADTVENKNKLSVAELADTKFTETVTNEGLLDIIGAAEFTKQVDNKSTGKVSVAEQADAIFVETVKNAGVLAIAGRAEFAEAVENTGDLALQAETQFAGDLENTGGLTIEADVSAAKIANRESASLVLGVVDSDVATAVAAPVDNEGRLDIVGRTRVERVANAGTLTVKAETEVAEEVENTGDLAIEADVTAAQITNRESASLVLGVVDSDVATAVAAPVDNEGLLNVVGKVEFADTVENKNQVSIAQQADTRFAETVTNEGLLDIAGKAEFVKAVDNKNTGMVSVAEQADAKFNETVANAGTLAIAGKAEFVRAVENTGEVHVADNALVAFKEAVNWNGPYYSGVGTNIHTDLNIGENGCLIGPVGAKWEVSNDFANQSKFPELWDTRNCELVFVQDQVLGNDHNFSIMGEDKGATMAGFDKNFAWGKFTIGDGQIVYLVDGDDVSGGALYVGEIQGLKFGSPIITNIFSEDGINIYYDPTLAANDYLEGQRYSLSTVLGEPTGYLLPTPVPASVLLLGSGLLGLGLLGWRRKRN